MKIGTFEGVVLTILSVVFDVINILLAPTIILNTVVNLIFGGIMAMWFMLKNQFVSEEEEEGEDNPYSDISTERAKYNLRKKQQLDAASQEAAAAEIVAEETATEAEAAEKAVGQEIKKLSDQAATQTAEREGAQATESTTAKVGEEISTRAAKTTGETAITSSVEKEGAQVAEQAATKAGAGAIERGAGEVAAQAGAKAVEGAAVKTGEKVAGQAAAKVGEKVTARILGRVLGVTLFTKIVPVINDIVGLIPLWTISTVLLWRQSIKDQQAIKDAEFAN
ncbi:MAG: hypothetical protein WCW56_01995 [Candidatus Paceibacterota bacterium]|jgi:hypothetical protein